MKKRKLRLIVPLPYIQKVKRVFVVVTIGAEVRKDRPAYAAVNRDEMDDGALRTGEKLEKFRLALHDQLLQLAFRLLA